jgi:two-component system chemotaxis response regulator CheY
MVMKSDNKKTLLIVDDSAVIRKAIASYVSDYDITIVGTANNGDVALEMFEKYNPDIVTLDITMPGLDGFEVLDKMVKMNSEAQILVVTALSDKATGLKALKIGAKSYITKPFRAEKLRQAFQRLLV